MRQALAAGIVYFAIVFGAGFLLGMIRVPVLVPLWGELAALLVELPFILAVSWWVSRHLVIRFQIPNVLSRRLLMGAVALALLLAFEAALSTVLTGKSIAEHLRSYAELPNALGLAGQIAFGAFPVVQMRATGGGIAESE